MNKLVLFFAAVAIACAAAGPISPEQDAKRSLPAIRYEEVRDKYNQYSLRYFTPDGTVVSERGHLVPNAEHNGYVLVVEGQTTFIGDDGKTYTTKYSAGLDGTKVEGAHLPVAPKPEPVPAQ